jgi:hypothetical protein
MTLLPEPGAAQTWKGKEDVIADCILITAVAVEMGAHRV